MGSAKAELIFHPVRMRLLQVLLRGGRLTAGQIGARLGDVPVATLYRQLARLVDGGVLEVVEERPVRGVVERVYAVAHGGASLTREELANATPADHVRYFAIFLAGLLEQFEGYAREEDVDFVRDGVLYRQTAVYLTDREFLTLKKEVRALIEAALAKTPSPKRRRRVLAGIVLPSAGDGDDVS